MDIGKAIGKFLSNEELSESSKPIYENVLRVFEVYFREHDCDLNNITYDEIFRSLHNYIDEREIKFENTARFFIAAVKNFIIYCDSELGIKNKELVSIFGIGNNSGGFEDKVDKQIEALIENKILKKEKTGIEIDSNELEKLIKKCNEMINNFQKNHLEAKVYNGKYMDYIGALGVKIIAYTGVKVNIITNMKLSALETEPNFIMICNKKKSFKVEIPEGLYLQLKKYIDIRSELIKYKKNEKDIDYLFLDYNTEPLKNKRKNEPFNNLIFEFMDKNQDMASSTARISKRPIIDMICSGMSLKMMKDLTGYGDTVIQYCQERADQIKSKEKNPSGYINQYLDKRNKETGYYNVF